MHCDVQEYEEHHLKQESPDWSVVSRTAVLADAEGLLTCYGVGEDSTGQLTHAVIELCFTSSVRFLQPGLLLQVSCPYHQLEWPPVRDNRYRDVALHILMSACRRPAEVCNAG